MSIREVCIKGAAMSDRAQQTWIEEEWIEQHRKLDVAATRVLNWNESLDTDRVLRQVMYMTLTEAAHEIMASPDEPDIQEAIQLWNKNYIKAGEVDQELYDIKNKKFDPEFVGYSTTNHLGTK